MGDCLVLTRLSLDDALPKNSESQDAGRHRPHDEAARGLPEPYTATWPTLYTQDGGFAVPCHC